MIYDCRRGATMISPSHAPFRYGPHGIHILHTGRGVGANALSAANDKRRVRQAGLEPRRTRSLAILGSLFAIDGATDRTPICQLLPPQNSMAGRFRALHTRWPGTPPRTAFQASRRAKGIHSAKVQSARRPTPHRVSDGPAGRSKASTLGVAR
jgi:hypothetical protein